MVHFYKSHKKYFFILVGVCLFIYLRSISNGYNLDDELVTIQHPLTAPENGLDLQAIFTSPYSIEKFGYTYGYRPMVHLSFALEHLLFGESPAMSHFVNLLIYVLTVIFLFYFLTEWLGSQHLFLLGLATFLFAIHPLHVEVVASIKNRDELLAFLAALVALHAYFRQASGFKLKYFLWTLLFTVIALLSKKTALPILVLFPIADVLYHRRFSLSSLLLLAPIFLLCTWVGLDFQAIFSVYASLLLIGLALAYFLWMQFPKWQQKGIFNHPIVTWSIHLLGCLGITYLAIQVHILLSLLLVFSLTHALKSANYALLFVLSLLLFILSFYFSQAFFVELIYLIVLILFNSIWRLSAVLKWIFLSEALLALLATLWIVNNVFYIFALLMFSLVLFFYYRSKVGMAFWVSLIQTIFTLSTGDFSFATVFLTCSMLILWLSALPKFQLLERYHIAIIGFLVVLFGFLDLPKPNFQEQTSIQPQQLIALSNKRALQNGVKEGRPLEFVENPLIYPHNKQEKLATSLQVVTTYVQLHFLPFPLRFYYGYKTVTIHNIGEIRSILSIILILLFGFVAVWFYKKQPLLSLGIFLFTIPLLMASNWFVLIAGMIAERHTYASTLGFSILLAWAIYKLKANSWQELRLKSRSGFLFYTVTICFITLSFVRVGAWQSPIVLMETDQKACQHSAHAHSLLATSYIKAATEDPLLMQDQKLILIDKAIVEMKKAIQIFPYLYNYHFDLGRFYVLNNDYQSASFSFENAYRLVPNNPLALDELVKCSFDLNRTKETIFFGQKLVQIIGPNEKTIELMAFQALTTQDFAAAKKWSKYGMKHFPGNPNFSRLLQDAKDKRIVSKGK